MYALTFTQYNIKMKTILDLLIYLLEKSVFWVVFIGIWVLKIAFIIILGFVIAFFINR